MRAVSVNAERLTRFGYIGLIWLVYLVYPLSDLMTGSHDLSQRIIGGLGLLIFLPLYLVGFRHGTNEVIDTLDILGILVLGVVLVALVGSSFFGIPIYAAAFAGLSRNWQQATAAVLVVALTHAVLGLTGHLSWSLVLIGVIMDLSIGINNFSYSRYFGTRVELERAREEVERLAAVAERGRIARDLHDVLGQTLTVITLKAQLAARLIREQPERAAGEMADVEVVSREALDQLRTVVGGYRSEGLHGELNRAQIALRAAGIATEEPPIPSGISPVIDGTLGLVLREAVTNVIRHSLARHCTITIEIRSQTAVLTVADDGCGLVDRRDGTGVPGMRERLATLGGSLQLESDGHGTRLVARIPLANGPNGDGLGWR